MVLHSLTEKEPTYIFNVNKVSALLDNFYFTLVSLAEKIVSPDYICGVYYYYALQAL